MANVSHNRSDISTHPDVHEMRDRYARMQNEPRTIAVDGLVLLTGLFASVSPWVIGFFDTRPGLTANNLVLGIAIAVLALCLAMAPERMGNLAWAMVPIGLWMIVSPWLAADNPSTGMIWTNVIVGALVCLLGAAAGTTAMKIAKRER